MIKLSSTTYVYNLKYGYTFANGEFISLEIEKTLNYRISAKQHPSQFKEN